MPHALQFLVLTLAGWLNRHQEDLIDYLREENRILREQLGSQSLRLTDAQRRRLAVRGRRLGRRALTQVASIVAPDTILRWYRRLIAKKYDGCARRRRGRPTTPRELAELVVRMAVEKPSWGYTRIRGALANLGHEIARNTVKRIRQDHGIEPAPERGRRTPWRTFLQAHWEGLAAADLFTVEVLTLAALRRYLVLFVLELKTRRVKISGIHRQPYGGWMEQMARNLTDTADGFLRKAGHLIHDRDPVVRQNPIRPRKSLTPCSDRLQTELMLEIFFILARTLRSALKVRRDLVLENLALRHQLAVLTRSGSRPRFRPADRLLWTSLRSFWDRWRQSLVLVHPATVVRWHREGFRRYWARKSRRRPGRPRIDPELMRLIRRMATTNPLWGAPRIHGELLKLGIEVSERTVSRWMPKRPKPPSQTWRAFLENHLKDIVSIDFFTVSSATFQILFVFVVLAHDRRRVLHFNVTAHPTTDWTARQIVEAFPWDTAPRYLLPDRDAVYGTHFRRRAAGLQITEVLIAPRSPWQNPYVERLIGSVRRECLDHVIVLGEAHLRRVLRAYFAYYQRSRTHLSLDKDAPDARDVQPPPMGKVVELPQVGGLHHRYERRAA